MGNRSRGAKHVKRWLGDKAILLTGLLLLVGSARAQAPAPTVSTPTQQAITVTLDVQPRSFTVPAMLTVTWNAAGASDCTASGGWNGSKTASGSEQVMGQVGATAFYLSCIGTPGPVTVTWTNPSKNTDGSNYTDAKHTEVYRATSAAQLPSASGVSVAHPATQYVFSALTVGLHHVATRAVNQAGTKSELSASATADVQAPSGMATPVTVTGQGEEPPPPTGVVSLGVEAYAVKANETLLDYILDGQVGTVEIGIPCDDLRQMGSTAYYAVNRVKYVTWTGNRRPKTVVAQCGVAP